MDVQRNPGRKSFFRSRTGLALLVFLVVAAFYLLTEHTATVDDLVPPAVAQYIKNHQLYENSATERSA